LTRDDDVIILANVLQRISTSEHLAKFVELKGHLNKGARLMIFFSWLRGVETVSRLDPMGTQFAYTAVNN
jgi:hypothetical protein